MKKKIVGVFVLLVFLTSPIYAASAKIGVVDIRRVFREAKIARGLTKQFLKDVQSKRKQLKAKEQDLRKRRREFKKRAKALSKKEREKELEKIRKEAKQIKHMKANMEDELRRKDQQVKSKIIRELRKAAAVYAKKHNYTVIIPRGMLLFSQDAVDITDALIKELNKKK